MCVYWTVVNRVSISFKGPFYKDIWLYISTTSCQAVPPPVHWIKLCYWPISLTMSSEKYLTILPRMCPEECGLEEHSNIETEVRISYNATSSNTVKWENWGQVFGWLHPFVFLVRQSKRHADRLWWNSCLNQTLSVHIDHRDASGMSPCKIRCRLQRESISRWSGNDFRTQVH